MSPGPRRNLLRRTVSNECFLWNARSFVERSEKSLEEIEGFLVAALLGITEIAFVRNHQSSCQDDQSNNRDRQNHGACRPPHGFDFAALPFFECPDGGCQCGHSTGKGNEQGKQSPGPATKHFDRSEGYNQEDQWQGRRQEDMREKTLH